MEKPPPPVLGVGNASVDVNGSCCIFSKVVGLHLRESQRLFRGCPGMNPEWSGGRLRELREQAGLSRQELADKAGLKLGGIRDLEQGRNKPSWETVLALCQALSVDCSAFTQEPTTQTPAGPGRPRKAEEEPVEGKPGKAAGLAAAGRSAGKATRESREKGKRSTKRKEG
jgi:transcriptional regulator with XRE-family HTH domain